MRERHEVVVQRRAVVQALAVTAALLLLLSLAGQATKYQTGHDTVYGLVQLFNVDDEKNVPTFFSVLLLLGAAALLWIISSGKRKERDPYALQWTVLAVLFLCMAVDEAAGIHELLGRPMTEILGDRATGILHFAWIVPGLAVAALAGLFFIKFLWHLPLRTRALFALAAVLYVGGALGVESIGGWYGERYGFENMAYVMIATTEESLEMSGMIVFLHALSAYFEASPGEATFRVRHSRGLGDLVGGRRLRRAARMVEPRAGSERGRRARRGVAAADECPAGVTTETRKATKTRETV
jgi:hypothetical protein